ncbi:MAG: carbohydrate porin, partial [Caulobacteraceae bacterium]
ANPVAAQTAPPAAPSSSGGQNAAPLLSSPAAQAPEASQAPDAASNQPTPPNDTRVGQRTFSGLQTPGAPRETDVGPFTPVSNKLADFGVALRGQLIDQYANNPYGGVHQGNDNVGQLNFGADVDLQKLLGVQGGSFHMTVYRDYGFGLAKDTTGTFVKQQNDYKNAYPQLHMGLVAYEQKLLDNKLDIIVGRLGTTAFYGHLVPACSFQSGATCGVPAILNSEAGFSLLPSATWGGNVLYHVTPEVYFEAGAFEVNPFISQTNGWDWSTRYATGVTVPFELSWSRPSLKTEAYPFELKGGGYVSTAPHADPYFNTKGQSLGTFGGTTLEDSTRDGVYVMGDRVVWRPNRNTTENLNLFGGVIHPLESEEVSDEEVYTGALLTGAIPGRPRDTIGLTATYFHISNREIEYLHDARVKAGGSGYNSPDEGAFELNYGWEVVRNLRLTPNLQYIANPDNSNIAKTKVLPKNILAFGLFLNFSFSNMLGFASSGPAAD